MKIRASGRTAKLATVARRKRIAAILARTKASRAELDARMVGAETHDLDDVPVIVRAPLAMSVGGAKRSRIAKEKEIPKHDPNDRPYPRPPIAPPVTDTSELNAQPETRRRGPGKLRAMAIERRRLRA